MGISLKLFRLLSLLACLSLVLAGGNWVHDAHASNVHTHAGAELGTNDHQHYDDNSQFDDSSLESWIHCGSDNVWVAFSSARLNTLSPHARGQATFATTNSIYHQPEKPPPRRLVVT